MTKQLITAALLFAAPCALGAGIEMGENGATTALQGGAFTGQADDLSAIEHNPAGLAQQRGYGFLLDFQGITHDVSFTRQEAGYDPANPSTLYNATTNSSGVFPLPFVAGSYGFRLLDRDVTVALGAFGPPAVGRYRFAEPNYAKDATGTRFLEKPTKYAPQRYALIDNDILIYFPTLSLGVAVHEKVHVGASLQVVGSNFHFRQALYSGLSTAASPRDEDPDYDSVADVTLTGKPGLTANFGVLVKPLSWVSFGASARLPTRISASGTLKVELGEVATRLNTTVQGDQADLAINLPLQVRVGAYARPLPKLGVNLDFVYEGWQGFDAIVLTPRGITMTIGANGTPQTVAPVVIPKNWQATYSGRLGLSYDVIDLLTVHAGGFYETSAAPNAFFAVDFAHPARFFVTGGATVHLGAFDVVAGVSYTPPVRLDVTDSQSTLTNTDAQIPGSVTGNGIYVSSGWSAVLGVRGRFGLPSKTPTAAPAAPEAPATPEALPAPEAPTDAPTSSPTPTE